MPTSFDGSFSADFDPEANLVRLVVDPSNWSENLVGDRVTIYRSSPPSARGVVVRGAEEALAPAGTLIWSDNEAPLDAEIRYYAQQIHSNGRIGSTIPVDVETTGAKWGVWLKAPGRPELTTRAEQNGAGDQTRETLGGTWQIPGGPTLSQSGSGAVAQSAGMGALTSELELTTRTPGDLAALQRVVRQAPGQVLLIQTGEPEELPSGYYQVRSMTTRNPTGMRSDLQAMRRTALSLVEAVIPAGPATGWSGTTYQDIYDRFATYQDIVDADVTYLDLATGSF